MLGRFNDWFDRQAERYKVVIGWALDHRWTMMALAVVTLAAALALPVVGVIGTAFFPETDESEFNIAIETPPGRAEYVRIQQQIADRAAPLRERLAQRCEALLGTAVNRATTEAVEREKAAAGAQE